MPGQPSKIDSYSIEQKQGRWTLAGRAAEGPAFQQTFTEARGALAQVQEWERANPALRSGGASALSQEFLDQIRLEGQMNRWGSRTPRAGGQVTSHHVEQLMGGWQVVTEVRGHLAAERLPTATAAAIRVRNFENEHPETRNLTRASVEKELGQAVATEAARKAEQEKSRPFHQKGPQIGVARDGQGGVAPQRNVDARVGMRGALGAGISTDARTELADFRSQLGRSAMPVAGGGDSITQRDLARIQGQLYAGVAVQGASVTSVVREPIQNHAGRANEPVAARSDRVLDRGMGD